VLLFVCYGFGLHLLTQVEDRPMWSPVETQHTQDEAEQAQAAGRDERATGTLWWVFLVYAAITAVAGYVVGEAASALVKLTELSHSAEGTVFAAVAKLPELVTAIAAVRIGAVNLAVGDVIEGNSFEVLFLAAADFFYRPGSIYHEFDVDNLLIAVLGDPDDWCAAARHVALPAPRHGRDRLRERAGAPALSRLGRAAVRVSRGRAVAGAHSVLRWRGNRSLASASSEPAAASRCERRLRNWNAPSPTSARIAAAMTMVG
jgi:Sodium/calcium exchanger protein